MQLSMACSIKECHRYVAVELTDADGKNLHDTHGIALCNVCEALIVIETQIRMAKDGVFDGSGGPARGMKTARDFAELFNRWRRARKGVTFMHAPEIASIGDNPQGN